MHKEIKAKCSINIIGQTYLFYTLSQIKILKSIKYKSSPHNHTFGMSYTFKRALISREFFFPTFHYPSQVKAITVSMVVQFSVMNEVITTLHITKANIHR